MFCCQLHLYLVFTKILCCFSLQKGQKNDARNCIALSAGLFPLQSANQLLTKKGQMPCSLTHSYEWKERNLRMLFAAALINDQSASARCRRRTRVSSRVRVGRVRLVDPCGQVKDLDPSLVKSRNLSRVGQVRPADSCGQVANIDPSKWKA